MSAFVDPASSRVGSARKHPKAGCQGQSEAEPFEPSQERTEAGPGCLWLYVVASRPKHTRCATGPGGRRPAHPSRSRPRRRGKNWRLRAAQEPSGAERSRAKSCPGAEPTRGVCAAEVLGQLRADALSCLKDLFNGRMR